MMPFLTEELWQRLPGRDTSRVPSICVAAYPQAPAGDIPDALVDAEAVFDDLFALVEAVRSLATERRVVPKTTRLVLVPATAAAAVLLRSEAATLAALTRSVGNLELCDEAVADGGDAGVALVEERPRVASALFFR
jgi:valyl-tRNA synthetase